MQGKVASATVFFAFLAIVLTMAAKVWGVNTEKTVHTFAGGSDGAGPEDGVVFGPGGGMYGTTYGGGDDNFGTVYELVPTSNGWSHTVLYRFVGGKDGASPYPRVIFDTHGNLYGTTNYGGPSNAGTVYELMPAADGEWTETVLYSFSGGSDGGWPLARLILDAAGNVYGTASMGGNRACNSGCGVAFELAHAKSGTWTQRVIHSFNGNDGQFPGGEMTFDAKGRLYGMTSFGGVATIGVVYMLSRAEGGWNETVLHNFVGIPDGGFPNGGIVFDHDGNLFGTTEAGGEHGKGTVFEMSKDGSGQWTQYRLLHSFTGRKDGRYPQYTPLLDDSGNLYGSATGSVNRQAGAIFQLVRAHNWEYRVLHSFSFRVSKNGEFPSGVVMDAAGNLYGTAAGGVDYGCYPGCGLVFEVER